MGFSRVAEDRGLDEAASIRLPERSEVSKLRLDVAWKFWNPKKEPEDEMEGVNVEFAIKFFDSNVGASVPHVTAHGRARGLGDWGAHAPQLGASASSSAAAAAAAAHEHMSLRQMASGLYSTSAKQVHARARKRKHPKASGVYSICAPGKHPHVLPE